MRTDKHSSTRTARRQNGFTLIEIMVVVVILGILAALVVPNILGRTGEARITASKSDLQSIGNALDLYKLDNYNYPSTDQSLQALVKQPSGYPEARNWNPAGYLKKVPLDPWNKEYLYLSPGVEQAFELLSFGADGREGGEGNNADISIWD